MAGRPLQHLHAHRGVGPGVADHAGLHRRADGPRRRSPPSTRAGSGGAWGGPAATPHARQRALHGALQEPRRQGGLRLVAHVLLAAEGPAVGDLLDDDPVALDAEDGRDLVAVVPHALPARPDVQRAVARRGTASVDSGSRKACSMRCVWNTSCTTWADAASGRVDVATLVRRARQDVAVEPPHRIGGAGVDGGHGIGDRRAAARRSTSTSAAAARAVLAVLGHHEGEHVAQVGRAPAHGDEHRPVRVDDPDPQVAGDVGRGEHPHHAAGRRRRPRCRWPARRRGRGRPGAPRRAACPAAPGRRRRACRPGSARCPGSGRRGADAPGRRHRDLGARGQQLDGVEDLDVAGAAAQVGAEVRGRRRRGRASRPSCRSGPWPASGSPGCRTRTAGRRWPRRPRPCGRARRRRPPRAW